MPQPHNTPATPANAAGNKSAGTITVNCIGGLANRMRAFAGAYSLARNAGANFQAIWQPLPLLNATFADLFMPADVIVKSYSPIVYAAKHSVPRKKNLYISAIYQKLHYDRVLTDFDGSISAAQDNPAAILDAARHSNIYLNTGISVYEYTKSDLDTLFTPNDQVAAIADTLSDGVDGKTAGIHIRRTDNAESIKNSPTSLFIRRIGQMIDNGEYEKFYLATDDDTVKSELTDRFGNRIISHRLDLRRDSRQGIMQAYAEMIALSRTAAIYGSYYSSYSEMSAQLTGIPFLPLRAEI